MTEQDPQHSGSRWDPAPGSAPTEPVRAAPFDTPWTADLPADQPAPVETPLPEQTVPGPAPRRLSGRLRRLVVTGAAAVALVAAGGVGGFLVGQAAAGGDTTVVSTVSDDDGTGAGDYPGGRPDVDGGPPPGVGDRDVTTPDGTDDSSTSDDGDTT